MIKRRGGQLDLSALRQASIVGNDLPDRPSLVREHFLLLVFGEAAVFRPQFLEPGMAGDGAEAEPGQVVPDLQVQQLLVGVLPREAVQGVRADVAAALDE